MVAGLANHIKLLRVGLQEYEIGRHNNQTAGVAYEFRDGFSALDFLLRFKNNLFDMMTLRSLLVEEGAGYSIARLTDQEVIEEIAWRLACGQLRVMSRRDEIGRHVGASTMGQSRQSSPRPQRLESRPQSRPLRPDTEPPPAEETIFPSDIIAAAIAEGMKEAADLGIPFCEECTKAEAEEITFPSDIAAAAVTEGMRKAAYLGTPFCEECAKKKARTGAIN